MTLPENQRLRRNRVIYLITPTYKRQTQIVDLTRLSQTLGFARDSGFHQRLYWLIMEDAYNATQRVRQIAIESGLPFAHKAVKTSEKPRHRGVEQRNAALDIVQQLGAEGVVYFMDDDNAYNAQLMHELSYITHVGVFGVGMPGNDAYERCHVNNETGKVDKIFSNFGQSSRTFPIDMAGFAFATYHLARNDEEGHPMRFSQETRKGHLEDAILKFAAQHKSEMEPLAGNCTRILAWHVRTQGNNNKNPEGNDEKTFKLIEGLK